MDGGRPVFKSAERSRSGCNARCGAGYNTICSVCMWGSSRCWCATTVCTRRDGLRMYQPSLYSGWVGSHGLSDSCHARFDQQGWGCGVLTLDCRGYGTPTLTGIPAAIGYQNASHSMEKLRIHQWPTIWLFLIITKTSNILYDWSCVWVSALGSNGLI